MKTEMKGLSDVQMGTRRMRTTTLVCRIQSLRRKIHWAAAKKCAYN